MRRAAARLPLLALAMAALVAALGGGLVRLGWALPAPAALVAPMHGPLMVSGFLGTLIGLERAVALGRPWAYAGPLASGAGGLLLILAAEPAAARLLLLVGSGVLAAVFGLVLLRHRALDALTMGSGAGAWVIGNLLWLGDRPVHAIVPWWATFLVLTIAGERLELTRLVQLPRGARGAFAGALALLVAGPFLGLTRPAAGARVWAVGLIALAVWLSRHDLARRTIRQAGLTRFIAACLLSGYAWLGAAGVLVIAAAGVGGGPRYDAWLHALFLGFVFAMIFGHAPIVFPAVLGLAVRFRPVLYVPLAGLHLTLALRVAGDVLGWPGARQWGGLLNAVAVLAYFALVASGLRGSAGAAPAAA